MSKSNALILTGAVIGLFLGSSMGIAVGGTAYNAALFLTPLGAFIGWLASRANIESAEERRGSSEERLDHDHSGKTESEDDLESEVKSQSPVESSVWPALALLATLWNFQIDLLEKVGLLKTFVRQPLLFVGLCIVVSIFFPPFLLVYFLSWAAACHFDISQDNNYRAHIK